MTCATIMRQNFEVVHEGETICAAVEKMRHSNSAILPVIDADGCLVGSLGINDLFARLIPWVATTADLLPNLLFATDNLDELQMNFEHLRNAPLRRVMNREPAKVYPEAPLVEAIRLFGRSRTMITVVERKSQKLIGVIFAEDTLRLIPAAL